MANGWLKRALAIVSLGCALVLFPACSSSKGDEEGLETSQDEVEAALDEEQANAQNAANQEVDAGAKNEEALTQDVPANQENKANPQETLEAKPQNQTQGVQAESLPAPSLTQKVNSEGGGVFGGAAGISMGQGLPEIGSKLSYVVKEGDTLAKISKMIFGHTANWRKLAKWSGLSNPNKIFPGELIYYQLDSKSVNFAKIYENLPKKEVVVENGESLGDIAKKLYGNSKHWRYLWRLNDNVLEPDHLPQGMKLTYVVKDALAMLDYEFKSVKEVKLTKVNIERDMIQAERAFGLKNFVAYHN